MDTRESTGTEPVAAATPDAVRGVCRPDTTTDAGGAAENAT